jgi:hypothetical protein
LNLKYKKGAFFDTFFFFTVIVLLLISGIFLINILSPLVDRFKADPNLGATAQVALASADHLGSIEDNIVLIVFIVLWITVLVAAYQIDANPVFFIVMAVIMLLFVMAAGMVGELTKALFNDANLETAAAQLPYSNFIANHLFIVILAVGFSVMLVMFAKRQSQGGLS